MFSATALLQPVTLPKTPARQVTHIPSSSNPRKPHHPALPQQHFLPRPVPHHVLGETLQEGASAHLYSA